MQPVATWLLKTSDMSVTEIYIIYLLCAIHVSFFKLLRWTFRRIHSICLSQYHNLDQYNAIPSNPIHSSDLLSIFLKRFRDYLYLSIIICFYLSRCLLPYHHSDLSRIFSQAAQSPRFGSDLDFIYPLDASSSAWRLTPDEPEPTETPEQLFFNRAKVMWGLDITDRCEHDSWLVIIFMSKVEETLKGCGRFGNSMKIPEKGSSLLALCGLVMSWLKTMTGANGHRQWHQCFLVRDAFWAETRFQGRLSNCKSICMQTLKTHSLEWVSTWWCNSTAYCLRRQRRKPPRVLLVRTSKVIGILGDMFRNAWEWMPCIP